MDSHESQNSPQDLENNSANSSVTTAVDDPVDMTASESSASNGTAEAQPSDTKQTEIEQLLTTMHDALKDLAEHFSSTVNHIGSLLSSQAHTSQGSAEAEVAPAEAAENESPVEVEVASVEVAEAEPPAEAEVAEAEPAAEVEVAEAESPETEMEVAEAEPAAEVESPAIEAESPAIVEEEEAEQVQIVDQDGSGDLSASQLAVEVDEAAEGAGAEPVAMANVDEVLVEAPPEEVPETLAELAPEAASTEAAAGDGDAATATESDDESLVVEGEEEEAATDTEAAADDTDGEETPSPIEEANETGGDSPPVPAEVAPVQQDSTD